MTNLERIQTMAIEDIAHLLIYLDSEYGYFYCSDGEHFDNMKEATQHEIEWLKSDIDE